MQPVIERQAFGTPINNATLWANNVSQLLSSAFQQYGFRLNRVFPKDGSETLTSRSGDPNAAPSGEGWLYVKGGGVASSAWGEAWGAAWGGAWGELGNVELYFRAQGAAIQLTANGVINSAALPGAVKLFTDATRIDADDTSTAGETALLIYDVDNAQVERVSVGAADSGGVGFKVLRIPN